MHNIHMHVNIMDPFMRKKTLILRQLTWLVINVDAIIPKITNEYVANNTT